MQWMKMYPAKCLRGNLHFDLPLSKRAIWYELLLMAGDLDKDGIIDYPIQFIVSQLGCLRKTLEEVLAILEKTDRIARNGNEITIVNWFKYQSPSTKKGVSPKPSKNQAEKAKAFREEHAQYLIDHPDEVMGSVTQEGYEYTEEDRNADEAELFRNRSPEHEAAVEEHEALMYDQLHSE